MLIHSRNVFRSKLKPLISVSCYLSRYSIFSLSDHHSPQPKSPPRSPRFLSAIFFSSSPSQQPPKLRPSLPLSRDGNYEEATEAPVCPGCGVHLQDSNPKHPGFYIKPSPKPLSYKSQARFLVPISQEVEISNSFKKGVVIEAADENPDGDFESVVKKPEKPVVCTRCHSLRHYGKVKDQSVENLLPDFDFDHTVGRRLASASGARTVILLVVDAADFDGSFPRKAAKIVSNTIDENSEAWKQGKPGNVPRVVLVVTKIDLLPTSLSPTGFEYWVRQRAREGGSNKITSVHLVSAMRDWGIKNLVEDVVKLAGARGQVWAIGAQNAGKSTLINAIGKVVGGRKVTHLTEAPVPGTTLGIVRAEGVLPGQAKLFDTPGLLHPHQITSRLNREELKLVHVSKELKPRTYRIKAGHTIHLGGLMRLDIEESSVDSIYVTVWASPLIPLHMGKTENAEKMFKEHLGHQLQPPIGENQVQELGKWLRREFHVTGKSWDSSSVDVAAAGVGWFAVGLKGEAVLGVWTYDGVDLVLRNSLIPHRAKIFEEAGFTVSKIVSKADQSLNKSKRQSGKRKESDPEVNVSSEASLPRVEISSSS